MQAKKKKKMGTGPNRILQRRYTDGQQTHEKMLNITNKGIANQNHSGITPPHTCQNGYHQKKINE